MRDVTAGDWLRLAVIDLGTNSTRLLIADVDGARCEEVDRRAEITRLGDGVDRAGVLDSEAIFRTINVLKDFTAAIKSMGVERVRCIGTSSLRDAENSKDLAAMVKDDFGFDVEILSGAEEARLSFLGATNSRNPDLNYLVFDVGGGSTEIVFGKPDLPNSYVSLDLGCVRLSERFLKSDPPAEKEFKAMKIEADKVVNDRTSGWDFEVDEAIGLAGTVTTLAAVDQQMEVYDPAKIEGYKLELSKIAYHEDEFRRLSRKEISRIPGIQHGREGVILAGTLLVLSVMKRFGLQNFIVSERDILDGAMQELLNGYHIGGKICH